MSDSAPAFEVPAKAIPAMTDRTVEYADPAAAQAANSGFDLASQEERPVESGKAQAVNLEATTDYKAFVPQKKTGKELPVLGGYEVFEKIGHGGMGAVFRAKEVATGREIALKVLDRKLVDNKTYVARFYREATVMDKLEHPHIIRCYGVGESQGMHYLALEYVDGGTLQQNIDRLGRLPLGDALHVTLACAYALEHAHERNLIHRDIKPENVLISSKGVVKLADLGLAKPMDDDMALTRSGVGAGTPQFMAPEQMRNARDVNGQADIYAVGVMLYYMTAGVKPFRADSLLNLIELKEASKFTPLREHCPDAPAELQRILQRMMVRSLSARYGSISTVIENLEALGLTHSRLSFIQGDAAILPKSARQKRTEGPVVPGASGRFQAPSASGKFTAPTGELWYVSLEHTEGKRRIKKMTAGQIIEAIQKHTIHPATEVSRHTNSGYAPAFSYKEFAAHCPRTIPALQNSPPKTTLIPQRQATQISHWEEPVPSSFMRLYGGFVIGGVLFLLMLVVMALVILK